MSRDPRLQDLLSDEALVGLSAEERAELEALLKDGPDPSYENAAASIAVASSAKSEEMPASLVAKLEKLATATAAATAATTPTTTATATAKTTATATATTTPTRAAAAPAKASPWPARIAWFAAAACLLLAITAWTREPREVIVTKSVFVPRDVPAPLPPTPAEERDRLLKKPGTEKIDWVAAKDEAVKDASGDVVWNAAEQKGAMRFHGLAKNNPKESQYQLWIFDQTRDDKYPVDGGVFDVDAKTGDVIIPITTRVLVQKAALFAVTVEKPGGVVVSKRERIILTAKTSG